VLQNYGVIIPTENSFIKFNKNKINSLQIYDTTQNYRILHKLVQHLSQHNLKILNHGHIQNLHQRKQWFKYTCMSTLLHCNKLHLTKCNNSWAVSITQNVNFNFQPPATFVFLVSHRSGLIESCSSSDGLSACKMSWSMFTGASFASTSIVWKLHHCHIQNVAKENNYSNKTCRYVHDLS
jgi:hypothetical protein